MSKGIKNMIRSIKCYFKKLNTNKKNKLKEFITEYRKIIKVVLQDIRNLKVRIRKKAEGPYF